MECPICYDSGTLDELKCSHTVCKLCISKLINRICPLCRAPIDDENSVALSSEIIEIEFEENFISSEIYTVDFSRVSRRARRRRTRERNREVEDIISRILTIPFQVSFRDLESIESEVEVPEQVTSREKRCRKNWRINDYPRRRRGKRSKR